MARWVKEMLALIAAWGAPSVGILMLGFWMLFLMVVFGANLISDVVYNGGISDEFTVPVFSSCSEFLDTLSYNSYRSYFMLMAGFLFCALFVNLAAIFWGFAALFVQGDRHFAPLFGILLNSMEIAAMTLIIVSGMIV